MSRKLREVMATSFQTTQNLPLHALWVWQRWWLACLLAGENSKNRIHSLNERNPASKKRFTARAARKRTQTPSKLSRETSRM
jgi:hypothetical protein